MTVAEHGDTLAGDLLCEARVKMGLTQAQLAARAGVAQSLISAYETGHRQPTLPTLQRLLAAAGLELRTRLELLDDALDRTSMTPTPTAQLRATDAGRDLVLVREFRAPIDEVWKSVSTPEGVGPWFGTWSGTPTVGDTVDFTMTAEEGDATSAMTITACTPPTHVAISNASEQGTWHLEARLREADGVTTLEFVHHLPPDAPVGEIGAGWEFYLDRLVASRAGTPMPDFDDYYPAMQSYFENLADS